MKSAVSLLIFSAFVVIAGCQANSVEVEAPKEPPSTSVTDSLLTPVPASPTQGDALMTPSMSADIGLQNLIVITMSCCSPRPTSVPTPTQTSLPTNIAPVITTPDNRQEKLISLAIADLSTRLSLDRKQVRVLSVEAAIWPDTALGCARPREDSAKQAEPGYLIVLEMSGQIYQYRADAGKTVILCDSVLEESSPTKDMDQNIDDGWPNETRDKDVIFMTPTKKP